ncbi:MAG: roadblock/LC7 domain-containing protein [Thermoplasmata archaeon]
MSETKTEKLQRYLRGIQNMGGVEGSAVVARNGLIIASSFPKDIDERRFAAMSATMMGTIETASALLKNGGLKKIFAETEYATIVAIGAGPKALLVVSASKDSNMGMLLLTIEEYAQKIKDVVEGNDDVANEENDKNDVRSESKV